MQLPACGALRARPALLPRLARRTSGPRAMAAPAAEEAVFTKPGYRRPLHWVFKVGDLKRSLDFYERVFGMKVHRHEEFASGCEATCNGPFGGAWSKTMVGHGDEASHFALELTYNYGISSYARGNDLRHLAVSRSAVRDASALSPPDAAGRVFATDPDGYRFLIVDAPPLAASPPDDPFLFASLSCSSLPASVAFYERGLGAARVPRAELPPALSAALEPGSELLQFAPGRPGVELVQLPAGQRVDRAVATGRFAVETEDGAPEAVAPAVRAAGGAVLHGPIKLQPHGEEVTIAQDMDGHEFCFVDARGYRNCIAVARTGAAVDWAYRQRLGAAAALTGEAARAGVAAVLAGEYDSAAVRARIQREAASSPVLLYSQTSCPYCKKSKELLAGLGARGVRVVELDSLGAEGHAVRAELAQLTGRSSVPAIYVGGSFVGGFSDGPGLGTLAERGELVLMLQKAGAL